MPVLLHSSLCFNTKRFSGFDGGILKLLRFAYNDVFVWAVRAVPSGHP